MKRNMFRLFCSAGAAVSAIALGSPALAHDGHPYGRVYYGEPRFHHPGHRVVVVQPPVVVYPGLVYPAPAPVVYYPAPELAYSYEPNPVGTIGGAIAGAAIGGIASHGRPGAIAAGSVIGAVVGSTLPR